MPDNQLARAIVPSANNLPTRRELQAVAARREIEDGLYVHTLRAHFDKETAKLDAETRAEAVRFTLGTELEVLAEGTEKANGSAAAAKLVATRVEQLSTFNSQNLLRRFGR